MTQTSGETRGTESGGGAGVSKPFRLISEFEPCGDQPAAIEKLVAGVEQGRRDQVLLGVTGSGKTFTMAHVIARTQRPTLIMAPNKTLAAQLYSEFRALFPENAVEYFVSYYDYYQPEAYIPGRDLYIEKDASINEQIDRMRHSATRSILERSDVIVVASVSCIYGLGSPGEYQDMAVTLSVGDEIDRDDVLRKLTCMQYRRNPVELQRGTFRARGDVLEILPVYEDDRLVRIEFFGDEIDAIAWIDFLTGEVVAEVEEVTIRPGSHYVTPEDKMAKAIEGIGEELEERLEQMRQMGKNLEAERLEQRTRYDLEILREVGFCHGIENYSRHLDGREAGESPWTLLDYFPSRWLIFLDESHVAVPQIRGMYRGDRARKRTLVEYGFRLPSALDNRPLQFSEFEDKVQQVVHVSATPGDFEVEAAGKEGLVEQVIRPTGLIDPVIEVRPARSQVDDLLGEIRERIERKERVLVTTLTKRMSESLTDYYRESGIKVRYMHSDIDTIERTELIRDLRAGVFDVLVGVNLLREGLDLPEVSLVAILDADKEGFLRSTRSLIQTVGRAARNVHGRVLLYADKQTASIQETIAETNRRRELQQEYNEAHGITPTTIIKEIRQILDTVYEADYLTVDSEPEEDRTATMSRDELRAEIDKLQEKMRRAAESLEFETAAEHRDRIRELEARWLETG